MVRLFSLLSIVFALGFTACAEARSPLRDRQGAPETVRLVVDGRDRTYLIQRAQGAGRHPLIVALHGGTRSADDIFSRGDWPAIAREQNAILLAPNAVGGNWNDGRTIYQGNFNPSGIDDVGFITELIERMVREEGADPTRIYVTGASNGGNMSWRLACERGHLIAAIAPVISTMRAGDPEGRCADARPMPVIAFFGTEDPLMRFDGAPVETRDGLMTEPRLSAPASTDFWALRNGCVGAPTQSALPDVDRRDRTRALRHVYPCPEGAEVVRYDIVGGGHVSPGAAPPSGPLGRFLGKGNGDISAERLSWDFVARHRRG